jgi:hypothetical protein
VIDEGAELERLAYILANPQKAGIAPSVEKWPGLSSAAFLLDGREQRFLCFDRTSWHANGRPDNIAPFLSTVELKHRILPQLEKLATKRRRKRIREMIGEKLTPATRSRFFADHGPLLHSWRQMQVEMTVARDRPVDPKRSPQPLCHATKPSLYRLYREAYRQFRNWYKDSARQYKQGNTDVVFPPGAFAPSNYPRARRPNEPDALGSLHLTRRALIIAEAIVRST